MLEDEQTGIEVVGRLCYPRGFCGLAYRRPHVYLTGNHRLYVIDLREPSIPRRLGAVVMPGYSLDVAVFEDCAYVVSERNIAIVDIVDPAAPYHYRTLDLEGRVHGIDVARGLLFAAAGDLLIYDLTSPEEPELIASHTMRSGYAQGVVVAGRNVYLTGGTDQASGFEIVDVSDPVAPRWAGSFETDARSHRVAVAEDLAAVLTTTEVIMLDIADHLAVRELGRFPWPLPMEAAIRGERLYLNDGTLGFHVFDLTAPASPSPLASYRPVGLERMAHCLAWTGSHWLVADFGEGLTVLEAP